MKVTFLIKSLVLAATLACVAQAEIRVVQFDTRSISIPAQQSIVDSIDKLIRQGWHIVSLSYAGPSHITFVLESPTKETTK